MILSNIFNQFFNLGFVLKKTKSIVILLTVLLNFSLSAKITDTDNLSDISVIGDVDIFNSKDVSHNKKADCQKVEVENQKVEIFVADGALIYNAETFSNVIIKKLEKTANGDFQTNKQSAKKKLTTKTKNKSHKQLPADLNFISQQNSGEFSQSQKNEVIVCSSTRSEHIAKAKILYTGLLTNLFYLLQKQNFTYTNPSFMICYFSGKYSVRPPTSF